MPRKIRIKIQKTKTTKKFVFNGRGLTPVYEERFSWVLLDGDMEPLISEVSFTTMQLALEDVGNFVVDSYNGEAINFTISGTIK